MIFIKLHTAGRCCSVALSVDGVVTSQFESQPNQHTATILQMIDTLLQQQGLQLSDLDILGFNCGPGAFTGLRIGASVAQGLAYAISCPVVAVSSLATLAQAAFMQHQTEAVLAVIDARLDEVYVGQYHVNERHVMCLQQKELLLAPQEIVNVIDLTAPTGAGSGFAFYPQACHTSKPRSV